MYVGGIIAILIIIFAVLMLTGVVPVSEKSVGGLFLAVAIALFGPFIDSRMKVS